MLPKHLPSAVMLLVLVSAAGSSLAQQEQGSAQGAGPQQERLQTETREYEQLQYERRLREARSEQERAQIRLEHQRKMQERARKKRNTPPVNPSGKQGHGGGGPKR